MSKKIFKFITVISISIFIIVLSSAVFAQNELPQTPSLSAADYDIQKANSLLDSGKFSEALEEYKKLEKKYPNDISIYFNEGFALKKLGRYNEALTAFNKVISGNSNSISVCFEIGDTYEKMNNTKEAQAWYQKATGMNPASALGYFNRGNAYKKLGKENEAKNDYINAYQMDPARFGYLAEQYPETSVSTPEGDNEQGNESSFYNTFMQYLNSGYNKIILIIILLIIPIDTLLIFINWRKKLKYQLLIQYTLDYIQGKLGMYTYKIADKDDEDVDYIDKTQKLIAGWEKERIKESLDMLNNDFAKLDRTLASQVREMLQKELDFRVFD